MSKFRSLSFSASVAGGLSETATDLQSAMAMVLRGNGEKTNSQIRM
jgi:hypothetical protein